MLSSSLKRGVDAFAFPPMDTITHNVGNYVELFRLLPFFRFFLNSSYVHSLHLKSGC